MDAQISEQAHQDDEGYGDPEFRFETTSQLSLQGGVTARFVVLPSGCTPVSRCTIAAAASAAMPRTCASRPRGFGDVFLRRDELVRQRSSSVLRRPRMPR